MFMCRQTDNLWCKLIQKGREKIGDANTKAGAIIDDALKNAEATKREASLAVKEETIKAKNEFEKETKERRAELQRYEKRVLGKELATKVDKAQKAKDAGFNPTSKTVPPAR